MSNPADLRVRRFWPLAVGLLELVVFVYVTRWIGFGWALLLMLATSLVGIAVLRIEGFRAWAALRQSAAQGSLDGGTNRVADTGVRILAGLLLTIPGFVTDVVALVLLIPPVRKSIGRRLSAAAFRTFPGGRPPGPPGSTGSQGGVQHHVVIEGEVVEQSSADRRDRNG